jgi:hypothetical protein
MQAASCTVLGMDRIRSVQDSMTEDGVGMKKGLSYCQQLSIPPLLGEGSRARDPSMRSQALHSRALELVEPTATGPFGKEVGTYTLLQLAPHRSSCRCLLEPSPWMLQNPAICRRRQHPKGAVLDSWTVLPHVLAEHLRRPACLIFLVQVPSLCSGLEFL